jgi:hypothetical protein
MFLIPSGAPGGGLLANTNFNLGNSSLLFEAPQSGNQPEVPEPGTVGMCAVGIAVGIDLVRRRLKH